MNTRTDENENGHIIWHAYCVTCQKTIESCANGRFADAVTKRHLTDHPDHEVLVGYRMTRDEGDENRLEAERIASLSDVDEMTERREERRKRE